MIQLAIDRPVTIVVGVILTVLFGVLSLDSIAIQLTPDVSKPQITVETTWLGASPNEIEREIVEEQEEQLRGVEGLERLTSESFDSRGRIVLEFPPGTDLEAALIKVSNRLEQVPEYPVAADRPVIRTTNLTDNAMAWFMLKRLPGNDTIIDTYFRLAEDVIKPRFERVSGVASSNIFGGREEELQVLLRLGDLAARGISIPQVLAALARENVNVSAGGFDQGKRRYTVRTVAEFTSPQEVADIVLSAEGSQRIYLRDVADVREGMKRRVGFVRQKGVPTIAINCMRASGANVLRTMAGVRAAVVELNDDFLRARGLELSQVYDETEYIDESIDNVRRSLLIGSVLAVVVLWGFLCSVASTLIVAVSIPVSIVGSFVLMFFFGRTVNVVSLAGMSFASGMVVDNAIVSLENIYRLRQEGVPARRAALLGASEVWGAILSSTLTTIAVFLPIFFIEERAGQLFRDIAVAISCSVGLSLIVSLTVIPTLSARLMERHAPPSEGFSRVRAPLARLVGCICESRARSVAVILVLSIGSLLVAWLILPKAEYLPLGNRNLAIGILLPPPGYNVDELEVIGREVEGHLLPRVAESSDAAADGGGPTSGGAIRHLFFVAGEASVFLGASAQDPARAGELVGILQSATADLPGFISITQQASLFERGVATGRSIDIEITGPDLERLVGIGGMIFGQILGRFPMTDGHQARPVPSLDLQNPEVHAVPNRERAREVGFDAEAVGRIVDTIVDGSKASDYKIAGREVDLTLVGGDPGRRWTIEELRQLEVFAPIGRTVALGSIAAIDETRGPQQINHIERDRAIVIQLVPAPAFPLEEALRIVETEIVPAVRASGQMDGRYRITVAGTADDLQRAFEAFRLNFFLAVVLTYLLLSALFESFLYPLVVLFSVPLAAVGGLLCLVLVMSVVPTVQLDILTMLGFVILVGVVVNNAILIVYRTLDGLRAGEPRRLAIVRAVETRIRPILMTTATSVFGMLPLVLFPGAGSELYRGLGAVVLGGLSLATVFTVLLIPAVLAVMPDRLFTRATPSAAETGGSP